METAKVDIRKLQLLNDRINQCIDALSQVRLSVHGLSHTQGSQLGGQYPGQIAGQIAGQGGGLFANAGTTGGYVDPRFGFGMSPIGQGQVYGGGLAHTPFAGPTIGGFPQTPGFLQGQGFAQGLGFNQGIVGSGNLPVTNQIPLWNSPMGLSHTGFEAESIYNRPLRSDPFLAVKVSQTFPYAQLPLPPVVPVY